MGRCQPQVVGDVRWAAEEAGCDVELLGEMGLGRQRSVEMDSTAGSTGDGVGASREEKCGRKKSRRGTRGEDGGREEEDAAAWAMLACPCMVVFAIALNDVYANPSLRSS